MYGHLEGQIFGPLPPYLMQNQAQVDMSLNMDLSGVTGLDQSMSGHSGLTPGVGQGINFDEIFAGANEEWSHILSRDHMYRS